MLGAHHLSPHVWRFAGCYPQRTADPSSDRCCAMVKLHRHSMPWDSKHPGKMDWSSAVNGIHRDPFIISESDIHHPPGLTGQMDSYHVPPGKLILLNKTKHINTYQPKTTSDKPIHSTILPQCPIVFNICHQPTPISSNPFVSADLCTPHPFHFTSFQTVPNPITNSLDLLQPTFLSSIYAIPAQEGDAIHLHILIHKCWWYQWYPLNPHANNSTYSQ